MKILFPLAALCVLAALFASYYVQHNACGAIDKQDRYIVASLRRSLKTIPTLDYYKHHPRERDQALAQIRQEIVVFSQPACH